MQQGRVRGAADWKRVVNGGAGLQHRGWERRMEGRRYWWVRIPWRRGRGVPAAGGGWQWWVALWGDGGSLWGGGGGWGGSVVTLAVGGEAR